MRGSTHSKTRRCDLSGNNFRCTTDVRDNSASCTTCSSLCTSKREEGGGNKKGGKTRARNTTSDEYEGSSRRANKEQTGIRKRWQWRVRLDDPCHTTHGFAGTPVVERTLKQRQHKLQQRSCGDKGGDSLRQCATCARNGAWANKEVEVPNTR